MTAGCCVAQHRKCVADWATSQPYLYEVLGGKADTMDAQHLRHTRHKISHPSCHRTVIVFTEHKKRTSKIFETPPLAKEGFGEECKQPFEPKGLTTAARLPETNSVKQYMWSVAEHLSKLLTFFKV